MNQLTFLSVACLQQKYGNNWIPIVYASSALTKTEYQQVMPECICTFQEQSSFLSSVSEHLFVVVVVLELYVQKHTEAESEQTAIQVFCRLPFASIQQ